MIDPNISDFNLEHPDGHKTTNLFPIDPVENGLWLGDVLQSIFIRGGAFITINDLSAPAKVAEIVLSTPVDPL